jgi:hypothetical protein
MGGTMPHTEDGWVLSSEAYIKLLERVLLICLEGRTDAESLHDTKTGEDFSIYNLREQIAKQQKHRPA